MQEVPKYLLSQSVLYTIKSRSFIKNFVGAPTILEFTEEKQLVDLLIASAELIPLTMLDLRIIVKD